MRSLKTIDTVTWSKENKELSSKEIDHLGLDEASLNLNDGLHILWLRYPR